MDDLSEVITLVCNDMYKYTLDTSILEALKNSLYMRFSKYDITPKKNEIICNLPENERLIQLYIMVKLTEGLSEKSLKAYEYELKHFLSLYNDKSIKEITSNDIRCYIAYLKQHNISNSTANNRLSYIKAFFNWLYKESYITKNPAANISRIKTEKRVKQCFSQLDLETMINNANSKRDKAIIVTLISTGCRVAELVNMNKYDINFDTKEIVVLGKGNKERVVYLDDKAIYYIMEYLKTRDDNSPALFISQRKDGDRRLGIAGVEVLLRALGKKCNINKVHPHKFRRTQATNLLDKGVGIEVIKEVLGHESIDTTLEYAQVTKSNVKASLQKCGY